MWLLLLIRTIEESRIIIHARFHWLVILNFRWRSYVDLSQNTNEKPEGSTGTNILQILNTSYKLILVRLASIQYHFAWADADKCLLSSYYEREVEILITKP